MILSATAHSKVNLFLGVGDVRDDGYHELHTVFQSLSLQDELIAETLDGEVAHSGSPVASLAVQGLGAMQVPTDPSNLVWRAIDLVADEDRRRHDNPIPLVALSLSKGIPTAGGMAGDRLMRQLR